MNLGNSYRQFFGHFARLTNSKHPARCFSLNTGAHRYLERQFVIPNLLKCGHRNYTSDSVAPKNILSLHERNVFEDIYPPAGVSLPQTLTEQQCFYCGFDPTAESLHIGNFLSIMALMHCQRAGHKAIAVIGTATARVGDPSEHSKDRSILAKDAIHSNAKKIADRIREIVSFHENHLFENRKTKALPEFRILQNHEWYEKTSAIDFIADTCRKFRMGPMMDKRYIKDRLDGKNGLILAEFMYQTLQAYDWLHLFENHGCSFQIGGIDQLGNVHAGQQLIRSKHTSDVYGLLTPLVTTQHGEKLGKTAGNSIWLDAKKTSPFEFYQFFYRQPDSMVERFLKLFTFIDLKTIREIVTEHRKHPARRNAQKVLATNVCKIVHGTEGLESAVRCSKALFGGSIDYLSELKEDEIKVAFSGMNIVNLVLEPHTSLYDVCTAAKAIPSGAVGERLIAEGGVRINGVVRTWPQQIMLRGDYVLKNDLTLLTVGKKHHYLVRWRLPRIEEATDRDQQQGSIEM